METATKNKVVATVKTTTTVKTLAKLPPVTPALTMALANVVTSYAVKDGKTGDYVMTPKEASAIVPVLIIRGINQPMIAKTLAAHLNNSKGKGIFGLLALANDDRKAFRSIADRSDYRAAKDADGEAATETLTRENW